MKDDLMLQNLLLVLKSNMEVYNHGTLESSNKTVRQAIKYGLDETLKMQEALFNKMCEYRLYKVENIGSDQIKKSYNKLIKK